jgi:cold shock CspA family protein/class 3 adenylate cyclase
MAPVPYTQLSDDDLPGIRDAIANPCNCETTNAVIDLRDSTGQKFRKSLTAYNAEYVKVVEVFEEQLLALLDDLGIAYTASYTGDGIVVVVDTASGSHHLINAVIRVLEEIDTLATARNGAPSGQIDAKISAAITTGEGYRYCRRDSGIEHISSSIDRASRLCGVASPGALFIDTDTRNSANMREVTSTLGGMLHRRAEDYLGELQSVQVRGVPDPVEYYEIYWGRQLYGVRSATVTEISTSHAASHPTPPAPPAPVPPAAGAAVKPRDEQFVGKVKLWSNDRGGYGFVIDTKTGEEFHFTSASLVYEDDRQHLRPGAELVFTAAGTAIGKRKREAATILVVGQEADGRISYIHPERPFGFIAVSDDAGNTVKLHMSIAPGTTWDRGDEVSFTVATNAVGARAADVTLLDESEGSGAAA